MASLVKRKNPGGFIAFAILLTAVVVMPDILKNRDHLTVTRDAITERAIRTAEADRLADTAAEVAPASAW